ncbi:c-type heme family protein [Sulfurospirillum arcachonense]|uniref:ATP-binding protein n=1 Tax=Sulfurospirillum arcachonense TaxID=57666 RepID=UPI00046A47DF|nr:DUF3365 domain-containing protein [Sulfurospirillum arcachonense]
MKYNFKLIIGGFVLLYAIITLLFFNFYKDLALKDTRQEAISTLNTMNAIRNYVEEVQRPIVNKWNDEMGTQREFDSRILSSSYITQYIYDRQLLNKELKYEYKLVATNPLNPMHQANEYEAKILNKFRNNELKDYFSVLEEKDKSYFFIAMPIARNKKSCLECHGDPKDSPYGMVEQYGNTSGYYEKVGDLRAMIYLKISVASILKYHKEEFITGGLAMFIVFVIFILLIYIISKKDLNLQDKKEKLFVHQNRLAVMGGMIGNISHQWKQPLTQLSYILINLELQAQKNILTNEKLSSKVDEANEQITFMSDTINDFKNFFSPKRVKSKSPIKEILEHSKRLLQATLNKNKIEVILNVENNFIFHGYQNEMLQVFVNIMNNAKDSFVSKDISERVIKISAFSEDNHNIITLQNNAGVIDEKVIDKIFEPYFSTKDLNVATGIGLYICRVIVESFNGTISVHNLEEGVVFTIKF